MPVDFAEIYALFTGVTPLKADCGQVCGGACCRDRPEEKGMLLFPGEREFLTGRWPETAFKKTRRGEWLLVCEGTCRRALRPLACRIFPLFPYITSQGRVQAGMDPRSLALCPLARFSRQVGLRRDFVRVVRRAGRLMTVDEACRRFLQEQTQQLQEWGRLLPDFGGRRPIQRRKVDIK